MNNKNVVSLFLAVSLCVPVVSLGSENNSKNSGWFMPALKVVAVTAFGLGVWSFFKSDVASKSDLSALGRSLLRAIGRVETNVAEGFKNTNDKIDANQVQNMKRFDNVDAQFATAEERGKERHAESMAAHQTTQAKVDDTARVVNQLLDEQQRNTVELQECKGRLGRLETGVAQILANQKTQLPLLEKIVAGDTKGHKKLQKSIAERSAGLTLNTVNAIIMTPLSALKKEESSPVSTHLFHQDALLQGKPIKFKQLLPLQKQATS